ncbi:YraN family protein [uncultured Tateyamaria sp.]|uniref:YraN family protein n=1 Tax=Tateyamaria sp. 1078 TaxID=3417464 RepID=UPI002635AE13|nr:YraN family protein [uncultured Tateyamaria sp.]
MAFHARDFGDAARVARGQCAYHAGLSAEEQVAARYRAQGCVVLAERWRAGRGELDLVLRDAEGVIVFVEVKKSRTFDQALSHLSTAQARRLFATAEQYLCTLPDGVFTPSRLDVALVNAVGEICVHENFFAGGL